MKNEKPGYKTTEFWLTTVMAVCGILMASGIVIEGSQAAQIIGGIISALTTLGYTSQRGSVKNNAKE